MKNKITLGLAFGLVYLTFMAGILVSTVGDMPSQNTDPYTWWDVITLFGFIAGTYLVGYFAGKSVNDEK